MTTEFPPRIPFHGSVFINQHFYMGNAQLLVPEGIVSILKFINLVTLGKSNIRTMDNNVNNKITQ